MDARRLVQFLTYVALLDLFTLALAARFAPPDPVVGALTVGPMLVVAPVMAYWFVYVRDREWTEGTETDE